LPACHHPKEALFVGFPYFPGKYIDIIGKDVSSVWNTAPKAKTAPPALAVVHWAPGPNIPPNAYPTA